MKFLQTKNELAGTAFQPLASFGFTLIELLVVFSLIAILSGIGIVAFSQYSRSQQVNQAANNVKLLIGEARFDALSGVVVNTDSTGTNINCGTSSLNSYFVGVFLASSEVRLFMKCDDGTTPLVKNSFLPKNITFDNTKTSCTNIQFGALTTQGSGIPCEIVINGYNQSKTISIDSGGNVFIQ